MLSTYDISCTGPGKQIEIWCGPCSRSAHQRAEETTRKILFLTQRSYFYTTGTECSVCYQSGSYTLCIKDQGVGQLKPKGILILCSEKEVKG